MTNTTTAETNSYLVPGNQVHALEAFTLHTSDALYGGSGAIVTRGSTFTLTEALVRLNPFLEMVGNDDAQIARWGKVLVRAGAWEEGKLTTRPGERSHELDREIARQAAWREPEGPQRASALAAVEAKFGPSRSTSTQIAYYGSR